MRFAPLLFLIVAILASAAVPVAIASGFEKIDDRIFESVHSDLGGADKGQFIVGGGGALALACALEPPVPSATLGGEFEHADFWEEHGPLLRRAWEELERTANDSDADGGASTSRKRDDIALDNVVDPALARAASAARADPTADAEGAVLSLWSAAVPSAPPDLGVHRARLLSADGLRRIRSHLDRVAAAGVPVRRPNGMNRHGVILDDAVDGAVSLPALTGFVQSLVDEIVRPVGRALFPADAGSDDDAEYFAFTIRYSADEDIELREHRDASVFTLNVNLNLPGEGYDGSTLYFVDPSDETKRYNVEFEPGMALLHRGALRHAAFPIEEGARQNLVIWLFGKGGDVRIAPCAEDEQLSVAQRWGEAMAPDSWWKQAL